MVIIILSPGRGDSISVIIPGMDGVLDSDIVGVGSISDLDFMAGIMVDGGGPLFIIRLIVDGGWIPPMVDIMEEMLLIVQYTTPISRKQYEQYLSGRSGVVSSNNRPATNSYASYRQNGTFNRPVNNSYANNRQNTTFTRPITNSTNSYNRQSYNNTATNSLNRPNTQSAANRPNNVYSDRQGNVYQRSVQGWQQRSNRSWAPVDNTQRPDVVRNLDRQQQMRDRGQVRTQNFQSARSNFGGGRSSTSAPRAMSSGGGGGRSSGGGGGSSRSSGGGGGSRR